MSDDAVPSGGRKRRRGLFWRLVAIAVVLAGYAAYKLLWHPSPEPPPEPAPELDMPADRTFDGDSSKLERTVVVPTLDTPMPKGKNVIWCASFQIAWNHLRDDVIKEPVRIANAEEVADRLNKAPQSEADLPKGSYYAAAGWVRDGIVGRIQREMAARFPHGHQPDSSDVTGQTVIVAYAYLVARVKFTIPFFDQHEPLLFKAAGIEPTRLRSFGTSQMDIRANDELGRQVNVLYASKEQEPHKGVAELPKEFAVDPCKDSSPNQIVLACVAPKDTLAGTLADVERKVRNGRGEHGLGGSDMLLIPNLSWRVGHHFKELEGTDKLILNTVARKAWVDKAWQMVVFRLDRSGAQLESEGRMLVKVCVPTHYIFDRPFLIYLKRRGAEHPFFVMWVDNAELLSRWK